MMRKFFILVVSMGFILISSCGQEVNFVSKTRNADSQTIYNAGELQKNDDLPSGILTTPPVDYDNEGLDELQTISKQFKTTEYTEDNLTLSLSKPYSTHEIVLAYNEVPSFQELLQETRTKYTDTFTQGTKGSFASEIKTTDPSKGALDLLIVIDNSQSMKEEQANLGSKLQSLLTYIDDSDWRIGVNTTDPAGGCLRALIKKGDDNIDEIFSKAINAGTNGSGYEKGILMAKAGIAPGCITPNWVRDNSTIAVLIVSDEDNCSFNGQDCRGKAYARESYLIDYLKTVRKVGVDARVYGIIWHPDTPRSECPTAYNQAHVYSRAISQTGGKWGSICDTDYSQTLQAISADVAKILKKQYTLDNIPSGAGVKVFINDQEVKTGFNQEDKNVTFDNLDSSIETIRFEYYYNDSPILKTFKLKQKAYEGWFEVYVNDKLMDPSTYTYSKELNAIEFNVAPEDNAKIVVNYKEDKILNNQFKIAPKEMNLDSLTVSVDGTQVEPDSYAFDAASSTLTFVLPPEEGSKVTVAYNELHKKLDYEFIFDLSTLKGLKITDKTTGEEVVYNYDKNILKIEEDLFENGKVLNLTFEDPTKDEGGVTLLHQVVEGTLSIKCHKDSCPLLDYELNGTSLYIKSGVKDDSEVDVSYQYISSRRKTFVVEEINKEDVYFWDVYVDGVPADPEDYDINENTISFKDWLPLDSVVMVSVYKG